MTDITQIRGGTPRQTIGSADQATIVGDGTTERPFRSALPGASTFLATYVPRAGVEGAPGVPLAVSDAPIIKGIASVTPGTAAAAPNDDLARVIGLILAVVETGGVQVRSTGVVTLSTEEWDAITGETGGLSRRQDYYLDLADGRLTLTPPTGTGEFQSRVGVAISPVAMLLTTPSDTIQE